MYQTQQRTRVGRRGRYTDSLTTARYTTDGQCHRNAATADTATTATGGTMDLLVARWNRSYKGSVRSMAQALRHIQRCGDNTEKRDSKSRGRSFWQKNLRKHRGPEFSRNRENAETAGTKRQKAAATATEAAAAAGSKNKRTRAAARQRSLRGYRSFRST